MRYFFNQNLDKILRTKKRLFLFLDYDGTLSPIVKSPSKAYLSKTTKKLLKQLSEKRNLILGIISGRKLSDIKQRIGLNNIIYTGNHGLELYFRKKKVLLKRPVPSYLETLKAVKKELKKTLGNINGIIFEDKGVIFAMHYRNIKPQKAIKVKIIFRQITTPYLKRKKIKLGSGKKVLEIKPNISFSKAEAVNFFQNRLKKKKNELTVFVGDDLTDEDVFRKLTRYDIGIRVGKFKASKAKYFLKNTNEVQKLLKFILELKIQPG